MVQRTGAQILVDQLVRQGVRNIFCVPGESYLATLDALHDAPIEVTACRHESGATIMAEAIGKLTGRPGICFVTRGPGATNASAGLHIARQDSTPLVLFVGQVARRMRGREAFQELDYPAVFNSICKWVVEVDDPRRLPELVSRAFQTAMAGRPGPVLVALPEDVQTESCEVADAAPVEAIEAFPSASQLDALAERLNAAQRPVAIVGGSRWNAGAAQQFTAFAERFALPVHCSFRRQMLFDHEHPNYAGDVGLGINPKILQRITEADLILLVGGRFSEVPSQGYSLLQIPNPRQHLIHVHADPDELGRIYHPGLAINATPAGFAASLSSLAAVVNASRVEHTAQAHRDYLGWSDPKAVSTPGSLQPAEVVCQLQGALPDNAIITNGAGNFASWVHRFWRHRSYGTQLAPTAGSMGYGVPAAIGAKRLYPDRTVIAFTGDGDFLMTGQEFATAVQYRLPVIIVLIDNGMYGTIRMHQEMKYPARVSATMLRNPDFADYARAFGGHGERVTRTEDFAAAFERARASNLPAILHCIIDPEAITPSATLTELRERAVLQQARQASSLE